MSILLESENHSLSVALDDPLYSSFLDSLKEGTGSLPPSATLPDYVLEQYESWTTLARWIGLGNGLFYMGDSAESWTALETLRNISPPTVFLADVVVFIRTLLDPPEGWERFVAVDERTPPSERRDHYRTVGRLVRNDSQLEYHQLTRTVPDDLYEALGMLNDPVRSSDGEMREALLAIEELNVLQGIRHDALLGLIGNGKWRSIQQKEIDWYLINWKDVVAYGQYDWRLLKRDDPEGALSIPLVVPSVAYAYAGVPLPSSLYVDVHRPLMVRSGEVPPRTIPYRIEEENVYVPIEGLSELYDRTLVTVSGRLSSRQLGLGPLLSGEEHELATESVVTDAFYSTDVYTLFSLINFDCVRRHKDNIPMMIDGIVHRLGLSALALFVTTLLADSAEDNKALVFCHEAVEALESLGTVGGSRLT